MSVDIAALAYENIAKAEKAPAEGGEGEPKPPETPPDDEGGEKPSGISLDDDETPKPAAKPKESDDDDDKSSADDDKDADDDTPPADTYVKGDAKYKTKDGKVVTVSELEKRGMMQADYSRKTAEAAKDKREAASAMKEVKAEREDVKGYFGKLWTDEEFLRDQLELHAPETIRKVVRSIAIEMAEEEEMDDRTRQIFRENRESKRQQRLNDRQSKLREQREQREQMTAKQKDLTDKYNRWIPAAMKDAGLMDEKDDEHNSEMWNLVKARILSDHGQAEYTEEQIRQSAKAVAGSRSVKALLAQKSSAAFDPEELERVIGEDAAAKYRKHLVKKAKKKKEPQSSKPSEPKPSKPKPKSPKATNPTDFFAEIRGER